MKKAVRSMTGFAKARRSMPHLEVTMSLKSVNHRALDLHFHLPSEMDPYEAGLRGLIKQKATRGHIDVRAVVVRSGGQQAMGLNRTLFGAYLAALRTADEEYGVRSTADMNTAILVPGMLSVEEPEGDPELEQLVLSATEEALGILNEFREREGAELISVMRCSAQQILAHAATLDEIRAAAVPAFQARLTERLGNLLGGTALEPQRLAQEAAVLVDRSDISEELARLSVHARELERLFEEGGELGKRIDFLLQEMNRETNTILSKTSGVGEQGLKITDLGLAVKAEIEKIREQALNVE
jgi:uncharacterized protein (TIGR00255 family)